MGIDIRVLDGSGILWRCQSVNAIAQNSIRMDLKTAADIKADSNGSFIAKGDGQAFVPDAGNILVFANGDIALGLKATMKDKSFDAPNAKRPRW